MTVSQIISISELTDDYTQIRIQGEGFSVVARGNWYQDGVMEYLRREVAAFTWRNDNSLYIDLKEAEGY